LTLVIYLSYTFLKKEFIQHMPSKRQINLLIKDTFEDSPLGKFLKWAIGAGRWIVVFTDLIVISAFLSRFYFDTKLANLYDDIKQSQAVIGATSELEQSFRFLQKRLSLLAGLHKTEFKSSENSAFVTNVLPPNVVLTDFSINQESLTLSGKSLSESGITALLRNLLLSPQVSQVNISKLAMGGKEEIGVISFSISAAWKKP